MKTQLIQISSVLVLLYVLCAVLFLSCNVLSSEREYYRLSPPAYHLRADEKARVSYEAETVTVTRYDGNVPDHLKEQYALRSIPAVSRSRVEVSINRAGQAHWVIEDLEPERKIPERRESIPPDLSPGVKRTVIHGDQADFYDASGKQIRSGRIDMPDLTQVNRFLEFAGNREADLKQKIARARQNGSEVHAYPNGNLRLRTKRNLSGLYSREGTALTPEAAPENVEVIELVDTKHNRIVATGLYDLSGNALEETRLKYRGNTRELQHIHSVSTATDRNRIKVKSITDTYFEYLNVKVADN